MEYHKTYLAKNVNARIEELNDRYYMYCRGVNEAGVELSEKSAVRARTDTKRDLCILKFIKQLLDEAQIRNTGIDLSKEAEAGYMRLVEPNEKHRRLLPGVGT